MRVGGALVTVNICHTRGHEPNSHRRTPGEWKGQPHWLSLTRIECRIRVLHHVITLSLRWASEKLPEWNWEL